jgi:endonuclease/exonuclease/phosphatase family metal-dependent hydrolase
MLGSHIRIGSLNVRSIFMESNKNIQKEFASYLRARSLGVDILCLQEVSHFHSQSVLSDQQIRSFSFFFPRCPFVVSKHCAIVCLKPGLSLDAAQVLLDERCVVATVKDAQHNVLCRVANIYAPAQSLDRPQFLQSFLSLALWSEVSNTPWMLVGDFNIHLHTTAETSHSAVLPWYEWLCTHFDNCFPDGAATFPQAGTTIDYIFGHRSLATRLVNALVQYVPPKWTDHCLLTVDLLPARASIGPGCWRFNPTLLDDTEFLALLDKTVALFFDGGDGDSDNSSHGSGGDPSLSVQERWESFKMLLKCCAQTYSRSMKARFKNKVAALQKERMKAVSSVESGVRTSDATPSIQPSGDSLPLQVVHELEKLIDGQIQKETRQHMLRSATRWHELGERNNKYFYRVIKERQSSMTIQSLKCSTTGEVLVEAADILKEARGFYQKLYTPDDIDAEAIDSLLAAIPPEVVLSSSDAEKLTALPNALLVLSVLAHAPKSRSPGLDGLPFEVYQYLATNSRPFLDLLVSVLGDAFSGVFPQSWQQTRMVLLYKKGDPQLLSNWRPLSLINSDAKLFTKLLANRFNEVLPGLINPYQTGFMPRRLISDNGWLNQLLMSHLRSVSPELPQVAVLLDQEKAYDRVHPEYLRLVLLRFGFPASLVSSLSSLFFGTQISVSINGWLGAPIPQQRGLRQGDPLSPLLFNLAFEPLLRSLLVSSLAGVSLGSVMVSPRFKPSPLSVHVDPKDGTGNWPLDFVSGSTPPPAVKLLSYADDLEVFLSSPDEWSLLLSLLDLYGRASNAKVNLSKTVLVSLSGVSHASWVSLADSSGIEWHDASSSGAVRYLGYPLYSTQAQLLDYLDAILVKVTRHSNLLKERQLSIRGKSLVANSLLLSKVYHILRVIPAPTSWLDQLKRVIREFMVPFNPSVSWSSLCLPKKFGGASLVDVKDQSLALHMVYIQRLLFPSRSAVDFVSPWLVHCIQVYTGHSSVLPWFMYPAMYKSLFKGVPVVSHLVELLSRLPPLVVSESWSPRWFLDLPLCSVVSPCENPLGKPPPLDPAALAPRYLLSDLCFWIPHLGVVSAGLKNNMKRQVRLVWSGFQPFNGPPTLTLPEVIRSKIGFSSSELSALPCSPAASSWLPSTAHWTIQVTSKTVVSIRKVPLGVLRRSWHPEYASLVMHRPQPPATMGAHALLRPFFWRLFWSLPMPAKAFTPWWRLLHDRIGYRARLHRWDPNVYLSPLCGLCGEVETLGHMLVYCPMKAIFWMDMIQLLCLQEPLCDLASVWSGLVTLCDLKSVPLSNDLLVLLGAGLATVWRLHWKCVIHDESWSSAHAINAFEHDHSLIISEFMASTSTATESPSLLELN